MIEEGFEEHLRKGIDRILFVYQVKYVLGRTPLLGLANLAAHDLAQLRAQRCKILLDLGRVRVRPHGLACRLVPERGLVLGCLLRGILSHMVNAARDGRDQRVPVVHCARHCRERKLPLVLVCALTGGYRSGVCLSDGLGRSVPDLLAFLGQRIILCLVGFQLRYRSLFHEIRFPCPRGEHAFIVCLAEPIEKTDGVFAPDINAAGKLQIAIKSGESKTIICKFRFFVPALELFTRPVQIGYRLRVAGLKVDLPVKVHPGTE